jgi:hypothetical protein
MTDFESVPARILEEHGIIAWPFIVARSVDVSGAREANNVSQAIDVCRAFSPERNTAAIRLVQRRFSDPEKLRCAGRLDRFELQPALDYYAPREAQCGQQRFVEWARLSEVMHPKVNVIVSSCHGHEPW